MAKLQPGEHYHQISFSGSGFLMSYHFGVVHCLLDNDISVEHAVGISGGAMTALTLLGGADLYVGIRQSITDLAKECFNLVLMGFNLFFMSFYFHYCWHFVCLRPTPATAKKNMEEANLRGFRLHDMSKRISAEELSGRLHVLVVAGRPSTQSIVPIVVNDYADDEAIVRACVLGGGIPGITTFFPRRLDVNDTRSIMDSWYVSDTLQAPYEVDSGTRSSTTNPMTIAVSPNRYGVTDYNKYADADVCVAGKFINSFPIHSEAARRAGFVEGYRNMQAKIDRCHVLDKSTSEHGVDAPETIYALLEFILNESYGKDWKRFNEHSVNNKNTMFEYKLDGLESQPPKPPSNIVLWITLIAFGILLMASPRVRMIILGGVAQLFILNLLMTGYYLRCVSRVPKTSFISHESLSEIECQISKRLSITSKQLDERLTKWISFGLNFIKLKIR